MDTKTRRPLSAEEEAYVAEFLDELDKDPTPNLAAADLEEERRRVAAARGLGPRGAAAIRGVAW